MKPSRKAEEIEAVISSIIGQDRRFAIQADVCQPPPIGCGGEAHGFRDELSRREYSISGLCQKCQDAVFGGEGD
ncbi:MAG: hypothetical protein ACREBG_03495 [Pyrinomonadaceae bacterium]